MHIANVISNPSFGTSAAVQFRDIKLRLPYVDTNPTIVGYANANLEIGQVLISDISRVFTVNSTSPDTALNNLCQPYLVGAAPFPLAAPHWIALETNTLAALAAGAVLNAAVLSVLVQGAGRCQAKLRKVVASAAAIPSGSFCYNGLAATNAQRHMLASASGGMASVAVGQRRLALTLASVASSGGTTLVDDTEANALSTALVEVLFDGMGVIA